MRVITAPEPLNIKKDEIAVFLAGGITGCPNWQKKVIDSLSTHVHADCFKLVVLNPRRENFPIDDPNAMEEQITWEFNALEQMDIFSMYFCSGNSDQPICMYELGRNIVRMQMRFPAEWEDRIIIASEPHYRRVQDVIIQTVLATGNKIDVRDIDDECAFRCYVYDIILAYQNLYCDYLDECDNVNRNVR